MAVTWISNKETPYDVWVSNRRKTIGASEIAAIVFGSKWTSNLEIWTDKVMGVQPKVQNIRMFLGTQTEDLTASMWEFYDGTEQSVVDNAKKGNKIKECYNNYSTIYNDKWPHLSATPDRIIKPVGKYAGRKGEGFLEIKNTMGFLLKSYEAGLPPENVVQLVAQMMLGEAEYGSLLYFVDNSRFEEHCLEAATTKKVQRLIIDSTTEFWDSVLKARKIYNNIFEAKRNYNFKLASELEIEMARLEPPAQTSSGYLNFLTERYRDRVANIGMVKGDTDQLMLAREHRKTCAAIKKQEQKKMELEIKLKLAIKENVVLDFGKDGKITYYANKNGSRLLNTKFIK